jgi:SAM-dependent methyltransferase
MVQTAERVSHQDSSDNPVYQRHYIAYHTAKDYVSGDLLEIGCGEGYGIEILLPAVNQYTAVDKYKSAAFEKYSDHTKVKLSQAGVPPLSGFEDNSFDSIVSFQVIEHVEEDDLFLKEIARVLRPGGVAIITTPNIKMSLTRNPWHIREYTPEQLKEMAEKHFSSVSMKGVYGNEKVMAYYEKNKASVKSITRFDILNLQYRLPAWILRIPYDLLNRMNRRKLLKSNDNLVSHISYEDYYIKDADHECLDLFVVMKK